MFFKKYKKEIKSLNNDYNSMERYADKMKENNMTLYRIIKNQDKEMLEMKVKYKKLEESKIPQINLLPKPIKCFSFF